ncbi:MAG: hypothetical protein P8Y97_21125 [Candidatus Lokiarchaeota archaeon]
MNPHTNGQDVMSYVSINFTQNMLELFCEAIEHLEIKERDAEKALELVFKKSIEYKQLKEQLEEKIESFYQLFFDFLLHNLPEKHYINCKNIQLLLLQYKKIIKEG